MPVSPVFAFDTPGPGAGIASSMFFNDFTLARVLLPRRVTDGVPPLTE